MMSKLFLLTFCFSTFAFQASGAGKPERIVVEVHLGDRHSWFIAEKTDKKQSLTFTNNAGANNRRELNNAEYITLDKFVAELPKKNNDQRLCQTNFFVITSKHGKRIGCEGGNNPLAKDMTAIVKSVNSQF